KINGFRNREPLILQPLVPCYNIELPPPPTPHSLLPTNRKSLIAEIFTFCYKRERKLTKVKKLLISFIGYIGKYDR
ncbi:MAG TPA: hypothetical protein DEA79_19530, partial [Cyanobacteria bacterium UBA11153]|nr:hypothetical protein [Cyanobacteria bacterium UBA11153]